MIISMHDLLIGYYGQKISPMITGSIPKGSIIAVLGSNGIGKSTFLKTLAGLLSPISGRLTFHKNKLSISYLPQKKNIDYYFPITVFDIVSMGCWPKISFFKKINYYHRFLIQKALKKMGLINLVDKFIDNLSGGQIQRVMFARILVQRSSLILLDEPFQGIDSITCDTLIHSIVELQQIGCTIIVALHDEKFITKYFSKILLLTHTKNIWKECK